MHIDKSINGCLSKMKKFYALTLLAVISITVNGQVSNQSDRQGLTSKYETARKVRDVGLTMTISGGGAIVVGSILAKTGLDRPYPSRPPFPSSGHYSTIWGAIGLGMVIIGVPVLVIGIPILAAGASSFHSIKKKYQLSMVEINIPGYYHQAYGFGVKVQF